jgi:hypothetical protein
VSPQHWSNRTLKTPNPCDTCRVLVMPRVLRTVCHVSLSDAATCRHPCLPRVASWLAATSAVRICHVLNATSLYGLPRHCTESATCHCTDVPRVLPSQHQIFACLTFRTERDIFSIRTPFDIKIIPPESGRRDGRNGTGFVAFRALSFLSIFQALSGFWIRFQITQNVT